MKKFGVKVDYFADLHVNHWIWFTPSQEKWEKRTRQWVQYLLRNRKGEVLVLAGDFSEVNNQIIWLLDEASKYYKQVFWTFGNHDLYLLSKTDKKKYKDSMGRIQDLVDRTSYLSNVTPLIKSTATYKGAVFAGDVMWYLPKSQEDWAFYNGSSNDSRYINLATEWDSSDVARRLYKDSADWYDSLDNQQIDVMVSHVPPIHPSLSKFPPNACYHTHVPFLASDKWICGHDHIQGTFEKTGTTFYMNSVGYPADYQFGIANQIPKNDDVLDPILGIDVKTFEI